MVDWIFHYKHHLLTPRPSPPPPPTNLNIYLWMGLFLVHHLQCRQIAKQFQHNAASSRLVSLVLCVTLSYDLLPFAIKGSKSVGISTCIYLSVGVLRGTSKTFVLPFGLMIIASLISRAS